jgi:hypothetical protein
MKTLISQTVISQSLKKTKEATYEVLKTHLGFDTAADEHNAKYFDQV